METPIRGNNTIDKTLQADDKAIIFKGIDTLQRKMMTAEEVFTKSSLTLSRIKMETMVLSGNLDTAKAESLIKLGDIDTNNVQGFNYLGVMLINENSKE